MKKKLFPAVIFAVFLIATLPFQSCQKLTNQLVSQDVSWSGIDAVVNVPAVKDTLLHGNMGTSTFTFNLDSMIKSKTGGAFSASSISKVTLNKCVLTIQNPDQANNFANFQLCDVFFNSDKNPTTAHMGTIPNNPDVYAESLNVPVDNTIDLKSYLYSPTSSSTNTTFNYIYGGKLRRPTTKALTMNVHIEYTIHVGS
jgi:hypothetical protein